MVESPTIALAMVLAKLFVRTFDWSLVLYPHYAEMVQKKSYLYYVCVLFDPWKTLNS